MDATASGAQWDRRAGVPVSDRPARGRTALQTVFDGTLPGCTRPAERSVKVVADGEVVWSWRPDAGVKFCARCIRPTGFEMHLSSAKRRWQTSRSPGRARSKPYPFAPGKPEPSR